VPARVSCCETVPGTGEVARFPAETLGTHKDGNTEYNVTSTCQLLSVDSKHCRLSNAVIGCCSCSCYGCPGPMIAKINTLDTRGIDNNAARHSQQLRSNEASVSGRI
jgi:hypothetical protein